MTHLMLIVVGVACALSGGKKQRRSGDSESPFGRYVLVGAGSCREVVGEGASQNRGRRAGWLAFVRGFRFGIFV